MVSCMDVYIIKDAVWLYVTREWICTRTMN